jgi:hypothetical protein
VKSNEIISSESELVLPSALEEDGGWGERERMKLIPNVYNMQNYSLTTTTMKNVFDAINVLTWVHTFSKPFNNGL